MEAGYSLVFAHCLWLPLPGFLTPIPLFGSNAAMSGNEENLNLGKKNVFYD